MPRLFFGSPSLHVALTLAAGASLALGGCGDDDTETHDDAGVQDAGDPRTEHCEYGLTDPTAGAGGTVEAGALRAAAVEEPIDLPVGSTLGAYGDRATALNANARVDGREVPLAGTFAASVGVETFPMVKVLALEAGNEKAVIVKLDLGVGFQSLTWDVAHLLGPELHGKVMITNSHSHGAYGHYTNNFAMQVAFGQYRGAMYRRLRDQIVRLAEEAFDAAQPARIGIAHDGDFDPDDQVNRDRRGQNDDLMGGPRKDHDLFVIRVDTTDGAPIAVLPVFGIHGTVLGGNNMLVTQDSTGGVERAVEESFDSPVVVMHLQGAAGDVSPGGGAGLDCSGHARCYRFDRVERVGHLARDAIMAAWMEAGADMQAEVAMEMLTRSIPLGPDHLNFTVRDGELEYTEWDGVTEPDRIIYNEDGSIASPIDEFNAPNGAALCAEGNVPLPLAQIPGVQGLPPYNTCLRIEDNSAPILANIFKFEPVDVPLCYSTRTTVSALRIGEHVIAGLPGEVVTLFADTLREASPVAYDKTVVVGYSHDNIGYLLTPEDWLAGGYEPSINIWGPLEGQAILERTAEVMALAVTDEREDGTRPGDTYMTAPERMGPVSDENVHVHEPLPPPDEAPDAGTIPETLPETLFVRTGQLELVPSQAQPVSPLRRLDSTWFVWIGEDPLNGTPKVTLEHADACDGTFAPVLRQSGRTVRDLDMILTWTPDPFEHGGPRTHYWAVEWQAVTPFGVALPDGEANDLRDRPGVPTGCYRFHVEGEGYQVTSDPFEVEPTELTVSVAVDDTDLVVTAHYNAPYGWRVLDMPTPANHPAPLHPGTTVTVVVTPTDGPDVSFDDAEVGTGGEIRVALGGVVAQSVTVTDRFDNTGSAPVD
jgi:neutral ceramidase